MSEELEVQKEAKAPDKAPDKPPDETADKTTDKAPDKTPTEAPDEATSTPKQDHTLKLEPLVTSDASAKEQEPETRESFLIRTLGESKLFRDIAQELLPKIAVYVEHKTCMEGLHLLVQEEQVHSLYIFLEGEAEVFYRDAQSGLIHHLESVQSGDDVGLSAVWLGDVSPFTVELSDDAEIGVISREVLRKLAAASTEINAAISKQLARRLHNRIRMQESPVVDLSQIKIDTSLFAMFPRQVIANHKVLPLSRSGGVIVVGFVDPNNIVAIDDVQRLLQGIHVRPVQIDSQSFLHYFRKYQESIQQAKEPTQPKEELWYKALRKKAQKLPTFDLRQESQAPKVAMADQVPGEQIIQLMNELLAEAMELLASDIHIEPGEKELTIRYRIDGQLKTRPDKLHMRFHPPLVSRFKVMGDMDIAERRQAQDGRMRITQDDKHIDFRLSTIPTQFGEKLVLRVLDPGSILIEMERLIPHEPVLREVRWMFEQPQGIVLVAGPTGSGKTTTIYSALLHRKEDEINIVTIEDPLEYTIDGIAQVQVNELAGVNFSNTIRHFLRQDPDVIVVGETRDPVTAATSIEAALTGHLVLTTIHANSAVGTLVRLRDMGIEPFLLANTVLGVISQRLVRRVCFRCRQPVEYHTSLIRPLGIFTQNEAQSAYTFYRGKGCIHCNFLGYKGRVGVFEVLRINEQIRPMIASGADMTALHKFASTHGMFSPMRDYARYLLTKGITTPEEITRALFLETVSEQESTTPT